MSGGEDGRPSPVAVFGIGGSGTRAVADLLRVAGVYLGSRVNAAGDAQVMGRVVRRWAGRYLAETGWINALARDEQAALPDWSEEGFVEELRAATEAHREGIDDAARPWGWKNPRSVYLLPLLHRALPGLRVVQLVRDGRDIAYSSNRNQLEVYGEEVVPDLEGSAVPVQAAGLWSRVNLAAHRCGRRLAPDRHHVIRYEDLCNDPRSEAERLFAAVGLRAEPAAISRAEELVSASPSAGRWRERDPAEVEEVEAAAAEGLRRFGYLSG